MKKILALILVICLLIPAAVALAGESLFVTDWYAVMLPEGEWEKADGEEGITYYYSNGNMLEGVIMFVVMDMDEETATSVSDALLPVLYNSMIAGLSQYAVDGKVEKEDSVVAGHPGMLFTYTQDAEGIKLPVYGNTVYIDGHMIAFCYMHMAKTADECREMLMKLSDNVIYLGK